MDVHIPTQETTNQEGGLQGFWHWLVVTPEDDEGDGERNMFNAVIRSEWTQEDYQREADTKDHPVINHEYEEL